MHAYAPLTIIPGWGIGRGPFEALAGTLNARIFDLPGYNGTPLIEEFNEAVDTLAANVEPGTVLMGWSLGSLLALAAAARHPQRVGKLILVAATASFCRRADWPDAMPEDELAEFASAAHADFHSLLPRFVGHFNRGDRHARAIGRTLLAQAESEPPGATLAAGLRWLRDQDLRPLLPQVTCPTLILHGAHDPLIPVAAARKLAEQLPDARLDILPGVAHTPFLSQPDHFLAQVRLFLA